MLVLLLFLLILLLQGFVVVVPFVLVFNDIYSKLFLFACRMQRRLLL